MSFRMSWGLIGGETNRKTVWRPRRTGGQLLPACGCAPARSRLVGFSAVL